MTERLGLLGGTFDPPHVGHLFLAYTALEELGLDHVIFIPARQQPLKAGRDSASAADRLQMTRLLVADDPRMSVDPIELDREGLSYSIDTVRAFRAARPGAELVFLMGEDTAGTLPKWREPEALASLARLVVLTRGRVGSAETSAPALPFPVERIATRRIDISATEVRSRVRAGLPLRGFVPDAVARYIAEHDLYRTTTE